MPKKVVVYVLALLLSHLANGQDGSIMTNLKSNLKRADEYYNNFSYRPAIELYTFVLKKSPENHQVKLKLAECYRKLNDPVNAAKWYATVMHQDSVISPMHVLYYAQALNANGQYEEAKRWYGKYQEKTRSDNRALNRIWGINNLADFYRDSAIYTIQKLSVNTTASDFSPSFYKDGLVFVSSVGKELFIRHVYSWDQSALLDVYFSRIQPDGNLSNPQKFNGAINSRYHEGPAVFYDQDRKMIFTRTDLKEDGKPNISKDGVGRISLFSATQSADGKGWTGITLLPFNSEEYSVGHPAISSDGLTLYFVSDMPGGRGGMDIYYSKMEGGSWSKPVNMGPQINTEGNEMFPFIHNDHVLYFSSDGYGGLGGLDVYKTNLQGDDAMIVTNPGFPINTNADDFAFILEENGQAGYFSSNRTGGKGSDDIYRFRIKPMTLTVTVTDADARQPLEGVAVTLISSRFKQELSGLHGKEKLTFPVHAGENYILKATKEGYVAKTVIVPAQKHRPGDKIQVDVVMEKEKPVTAPLVAYVYDAESGKALPSAQVYLLDEVTSDEKALTGGPDGIFSFDAYLASSYAIIVELGDKSGILSGIVAQNPAIARNDTIRIPLYSAAKSADKKQLAKIALEGLIIDGSNRMLLSGANVKLYEMKSRKETKISPKDGKITVDLEPGNYVLKVDKDAYSNKSIAFSTGNIENKQKPQLKVSLDKGAPRSAPLTAYVYDADTHEAIAGAAIYLLNEATSEEQNLQTGANGYFQFEAKLDCSYAIIAEKGDKSNVMTSVVAQNPATSPTDTLQIPLAGPAASQLVTKEIHPATIISAIREEGSAGSPAASIVVIRGSTVDEQTGLPVDDASVTLFDNATGREMAGYVEKGQTYFDVKAGSNYILKASKPGYRNKTSIVTTKELTARDTMLVKVPLEKLITDNALVKTQPYNQKTGVPDNTQPTTILVEIAVIDEESSNPLAGAQVYLLDQNTGDEQRLVTDQAGLVHVKSDPAANYSIIVDKDDKSGVLMDLLAADIAGKEPVRIPVSRRKTNPDNEPEPVLALQKEPDSNRIAEPSHAGEIKINTNRQFSSLPAAGSRVLGDNGKGAEIFAIKNTSGLEQAFVRYKGRAYEFKRDENLKYLQAIDDKMRLVIDQTDDEAEIELAGLLEDKLKETAVSVKSSTRVTSIYYNLDQTRLREDARAELDKLVIWLKKNPSLQLEVRAHTDSRQTDTYNLTLSAQRAREVSAYLVAKGIPKNRIKLKYFGESELVNDCCDGASCTEEQHQHNRRTEFMIRY